MRIESRVVAAGRPETPGAPVNTPIVLTAPYRNDPEDNFYSRATPTETRAALEAVRWPSAAAWPHSAPW
jgi:hypothetical protein